MSYIGDLARTALTHGVGRTLLREARDIYYTKFPGREKPDYAIELLSSDGTVALHPADIDLFKTIATVDPNSRYFRAMITGSPELEPAAYPTSLSDLKHILAEGFQKRPRMKGDEIMPYLGRVYHARVGPKGIDREWITEDDTVRGRGDFDFRKGVYRIKPGKLRDRIVKGIFGASIPIDYSD